MAVIADAISPIQIYCGAKRRFLMKNEINIYEKQVVNFCIRANSGKHRLSPMKAIRAKCLDCTMYQFAEVTRCDIKECPLWKFRGGRNLTAPRSPAHAQKRVFPPAEHLAPRAGHTR